MVLEGVTSAHRAALLAWYLAHGEGWTTARVIRFLYGGALGKRRCSLRLLRSLVEVLPIEEVGGVWQRVEGGTLARPYTPVTRAAVLGWAFAEGRELTVADVTALTGLRYRSAMALLFTISTVLPIYDDAPGDITQAYVWRSLR